jgi:hypothetical protein
MFTKLRRFALLAGAALAISAFAAPAAFGATEVRNAETEELCPEVQPPIEPVEGAGATSWLFGSGHKYESGGCTVRVYGTGVVAAAHSNGNNKDYCNYEMTVRVGPDGWGYVDSTKFWSCTFYTTQECAGDRIVAPAEYNPVFLGGKGIFKYANASTDLNLAFCANLPTFAGNYQGLTSYDLKPTGWGEQAWSNQQTDAAHWSWYNHTATGFGLYPEEDLLITH